jgi:CrcB protein
MREVLLVGIGGGAGSIARYLVSRVITTGSGFPWATLTVNVVGSLAIGLAAGLFATRLDDSLRIGLVVGFLGGFTTFSAFSAETVELVRSGSPALGVVNMAVSMLLGVAAAVIGVLVGESLASG